MPGNMRIRVWDVEHGCCAMIQKVTNINGQEYGGRLAMIDSGSSSDFSPSNYIRNVLGRTVLDYLFITNADQDHMSDLKGLVAQGVRVNTLFRNPSYTGEELRAIKRQGGPLSTLPFTQAPVRTSAPRPANRSTTTWTASPAACLTLSPKNVSLAE